MKNKIFLFIVFGAFGFAVFTLYTNVRKAKSELNNYAFYSSEQVQPQAVFTVSSSQKRVRRAAPAPSVTYIVDNSLVTPSNRSISKGTANPAGWQSANSGAGSVGRIKRDKPIQELNMSNTPIIVGARTQSKNTVSDLAAFSSSMPESGLAAASHPDKVATNSETLTGGVDDSYIDPGTDPNSSVPLGNGGLILVPLIFLYALFVVRKK